MKICVAEVNDFSPLIRQKLAKLGELRFENLNHGDLREVFNTYQVFWFRLGFTIDAELINHPNRTVKIIVCPVTGLNHIDVEACANQGVQILSLKGETTFLREVRATAEHTLALTLALIRKLPQAISSVQESNWDREPFKGTELYGKRVGIIGLGRLGCIVGGYFKAFGAEVVGYDRQVERPWPYLRLTLENLLQTSDIVSLHIDYSVENEGFLSSSHFGLMKRGVLFINTSRGNLVDEIALVKALSLGYIKACACDVITDEFQVERSPLFQLAQSEPSKVLLTPHIGGNTYESFEKTESFMYQKLVNFLKLNDASREG